MAQQILELFPLSELPPRPVSEDQDVPHLREIQKNLVYQKPRAVEEDESGDVKRPGDLYRRYRTVADLPENAKAFYEKAGEVSLFY